MEPFTIFLLVVVIFFFIIGLIGLILPVVPSLPLIWLGILIYAFFTDFQQVDGSLLIFTGLITIAGTAFDFLATALGARMYGSSWRGSLGALVGGLIGFLMLNVVGLIVGSAIGAFGLEYLSHHNRDQAIKAMWGSLLGFLFGTLVKAVAALWMIILFFMAIF